MRDVIVGDIIMFSYEETDGGHTVTCSEFFSSLTIPSQVAILGELFRHLETDLQNIDNPRYIPGVTGLTKQQMKVELDILRDLLKQIKEEQRWE